MARPKGRFQEKTQWLLLKIRGLAKKEGHCFAYNKYFSQQFGVTTRQIGRYLVALQKSGDIEVDIFRWWDNDRKCVRTIRKIKPLKKVITAAKPAKPVEEKPKKLTLDQWKKFMKEKLPAEQEPLPPRDGNYFENMIKRQERIAQQIRERKAILEREAEDDIALRVWLRTEATRRTLDLIETRRRT